MVSAGEFAYYLASETINALLDAINAANMANEDRRGALLHGIDVGYVAKLPRKSSIGDQYESDLEQLNKTRVLANGQVPLEIWLHNARDGLAREGRIQKSIFEDALRLMDGKLPHADQGSVENSQPVNANKWGDSLLGYAIGLIEERRMAEERGDNKLVAEIRTKIRALRKDESKQDQLFPDLLDIENEPDGTFAHNLHPVIQQCVLCDNKDARDQLCSLLDFCCGKPPQDESDWQAVTTAIFRVWRFFKHRPGTRDLIIAAMKKVGDAGRHGPICDFCAAPGTASMRVLLLDYRLLQLDLCSEQRSLDYCWPAVYNHKLVTHWEDKRLHEWFELEPSILVSIPPAALYKWQDALLESGPLSGRCGVCVCPTNHDAIILALSFQHQQESSLSYLIEEADDFFSFLVPVDFTFSAQTANQNGYDILVQCVKAFGDYWLELLSMNDWLWYGLSEDTQNDLVGLFAWSINDISRLRARFRRTFGADWPKLRPDLQIVLNKTRQGIERAPATASPSRQDLLDWLNVRPLQPGRPKKEQTLLLIRPQTGGDTTSLFALDEARHALNELAILLDQEQIIVRAFIAAPQSPPTFSMSPPPVETIWLEWTDNRLLEFVDNYISFFDKHSRSASRLFAQYDAGRYRDLLRPLVQRAQGSPARLLLLLRDAMWENMKQKHKQPAELDKDDVSRALAHYEDRFA